MTRLGVFMGLIGAAAGAILPLADQSQAFWRLECPPSLLHELMARTRAPENVGKSSAWTDVATAEARESASLDAGWQTLLQHGAASPAITTDLILKVHRAVVDASNGTALPAGAYRSGPVSVAGHRFLPAASIPAAMATLVDEMANLASTGASPFVRAATMMTRVTNIIHPFRDGNGRTAILLGNWIMHLAGLPTPVGFTGSLDEWDRWMVGQWHFEDTGDVSLLATHVLECTFRALQRTDPAFHREIERGCGAGDGDDDDKAELETPVGSMDPVYAQRLERITVRGPGGILVEQHQIRYRRTGDRDDDRAGDDDDNVIATRPPPTSQEITTRPPSQPRATRPPISWRCPSGSYATVQSAVQVPDCARRRSCPGNWITRVDSHQCRCACISGMAPTVATTAVPPTTLPTRPPTTPTPPPTTQPTPLPTQPPTMPTPPPTTRPTPLPTQPPTMPTPPPTTQPTPLPTQPPITPPPTTLRTTTPAATTAPGCRTQTGMRADGETWQNAGDDCTHFSCRNGAVFQHIQSCAPPQCDDPPVTVEGQCCPACEGAGGTGCGGGCPVSDCADPIQVDGQCCPVCPGASTVPWTTAEASTGDDLVTEMSASTTDATNIVASTDSPTGLPTGSPTMQIIADTSTDKDAGASSSTTMWIIIVLLLLCIVAAALVMFFKNNKSKAPQKLNAFENPVYEMMPNPLARPTAASAAANVQPVYHASVSDTYGGEGVTMSANAQYAEVDAGGGLVYMDADGDSQPVYSAPGTYDTVNLPQAGTDIDTEA